MSPKTLDNKDLQICSVIEGPQRAPWRSFHHAMGTAAHGQINRSFGGVAVLRKALRCVCALSFAAGIFTISPTAGQADEQLGDLGQSMFFSFRQATKKIAPDFDIRVWTSNLEKALISYRKGEFVKAHKLFKAVADDNDPMAHWWLGRMYQLGQGVPKNDGAAFYHFRQAALEFDGLESPGPLMGAKLDSLVQVGRYYLTGVPNTTIKRQPRRAFRIFQTAAQFSHPGAQYGIGVMLYDGQGIEKRQRRAMKWLKLSAQKHFPLALAKLGEIYWDKRANTANMVRALMWYSLAQNAVISQMHSQIVDRYNQLASQAPGKVLREAHQMALRWSRRYPPPQHRIEKQPVSNGVREVSE